ncbi:HAMP domain-containing sensor histidine kinase [Streptomyces uncialis]|uniref:sensor histidine kinase n=1 Tax=Streptomyces uncialis TaxID=1048205 RepID=UPI002E34D59D|nr:HAMP domain-containing sensor histidine kinase [Streptomyces uncialis]
MSLFWRIFLLNAAMLVVAAVLLLGPVTVSTPVRPGEALAVVAGLGLMLAVSAFILRIGLAPLGRLSRAMATADLLRPGGRPAATGPAEMAELIGTYHTMLDRLEHDRASSTARVLSAQEDERQRIAQELHDEVGQTLTAVLLQLKRVADRTPGELREEVTLAQDATRGSLDEIRRIARRLRPGVLDELGLVSALRALAAEFPAHDVRVRTRVTGFPAPGDDDPGAPPSLGHETELVVYRVAQEALTNVARHAHASHVTLELRRVSDRVELRVIDDGRGIGSAAEGAGVRGMRERALLIGAELVVGPRQGATGTEVLLRVHDEAEGITS